MAAVPEIASTPLSARLKAALPVFVAALWWGSLSVVGFLAVPLLFANLPTPSMAGSVAAKLFSAQSWLSLVCGLVLLLLARTSAQQTAMSWAQGALAFVIGGMLLALLGEFAVAPHIVARQNLALWHSLGTVMYVGQWLCAGAVLWKLAQRAPA